jgi:hypothetical protein
MPELKSSIARTFAFRPSLLTRLRDRIRLRQGAIKVSLFDVIAALVWITVLNIRGRNNDNTSGIRRLMYPIEVRQRLGIPIDYIGNIVIHTLAQLPLSDVNSSDYFLTSDVSKLSECTIQALSQAAIACRAANNWMNGENILDCLAFRTAILDLQSLHYCIDFQPSGRADQHIASWAHMWPATKWDIAGVPKNEPDFVRRVNTPWCFLLCPRKGGMKVEDGDGDDNLFEVFLKLSVDDMELLCGQRFGWLGLVEERGSGKKWLD